MFNSGTGVYKNVKKRLLVIRPFGQRMVLRSRSKKDRNAETSVRTNFGGS